MPSIFPDAQHLRSRTLIRLAGASAAIGMIAGCAGDSVSPAAHAAVRDMSLSFMTAPAVQTGTTPAADTVVGSSGSPTGTALQAVSGGDTLLITRVQLVLSRLELTQTTGASCENDDENDTTHGPMCTEVERGSVLVDLPTDTSVQTDINANIPAGTYASLEARLRPQQSGNGRDDAAFLALHPEFQGVNVRVEGTFRGVPFVYTGAADAKLELVFSPPLAADSTGLNVTIHVDVTRWFRDSAGGLIDPATANRGGTNTSLVLNNIQQSFRAFRDDGRDGHEDGDGHHGGDGNDNSE